MPRLERFDGTSSAITESFSPRRGLRPPLDSPANTRTAMPQPTPQYGHVVSTVRAILAGASFGRSAPVGHVATHWPHEVHTDEAMALVRFRQHRARQVEHGFSHADRVGVHRGDDHAVARGQVAGGRQPALALDVDEAGPARAERRPVGILAELRQRDPQAVHAVEDGGALGELDPPAVYRELHRGLMIRRTRPGTRRAPTGPRTARPGRGRRAKRAG